MTQQSISLPVVATSDATLAKIRALAEQWNTDARYSGAADDPCARKILEVLDAGPEAAHTQQDVTAAEPLCPACQGSGEGTEMEGAGPDAYEVPCNCQYCGGTGGLVDAYNGVLALLAAERAKYLELCGKVHAAKYIGVSPSDEKNAERDAVLEEAAKICDEENEDEPHPAPRRCAAIIRGLKSVSGTTRNASVPKGAEQVSHNSYRGFYFTDYAFRGVSGAAITGTYNNTKLPPKTYFNGKEQCIGYIDCYLDNQPGTPAN